MRTWLAVIVVAFICAPALAEDSTGGSVDPSIKEHYKDFDAAWAKHDAKAVAAFYTAKAEIVTESGDTFSGRDAIEQLFTDAFANALKDSTLTVTLQKTRLIKPDVAIVDGDLQIKPGDGEPIKFHLVGVLVKEDGKWLTETSRAVVYKQ